MDSVRGAPNFRHRVTRVTQEDDCTVSFTSKIWGKTKAFTVNIETQPDKRMKWRVTQGMALAWLRFINWVPSSRGCCSGSRWTREAWSRSSLAELAASRARRGPIYIVSTRSSTWPSTRPVRGVA